MAYAGFRVFMGLAIAFYHGLVNFADFNSIKNGGAESTSVVLGDIQSLGLPSPLAMLGLVATIETVGGLLIAAGLLTRIASAAIATMILIAFFGVHGANFIDGELALLYSIPFVFIAFQGAGKFGVDPMLRGRSGS